MENNQIAKRPELRPVPKLDELYGNVELASKYNDLNKLLNCQPKKEWVKQNKFANNTNYLPIEIVEYLLNSIFIRWWFEIKTVSVIANSVVVTGRLHVMDPITGEWMCQDGVGASPIQTKAGAPATDFAQVNTSAVQMAAPAAESYALKDAAEKFGRIFGKDLNRKDMVNYEAMQNSKFVPQEKPDIPQELKDVIAFADKEALANIYKTNTEYHSNPEFMRLLTQRKAELTNANTVNA